MELWVAVDPNAEPAGVLMATSFGRWVGDLTIPTGHTLMPINDQNPAAVTPTPESSSSVHRVQSTPL